MQNPALVIGDGATLTLTVATVGFCALEAAWRTWKAAGELRSGDSRVIEETLDIVTKDGAMETFTVHPERGGPYPPVFLMMDAPGIREELRMMARRLATVGYYVLLPTSITAPGATRSTAPTCW
jgi:hypothetical protein